MNWTAVGLGLLIVLIIGLFAIPWLLPENDTCTILRRIPTENGTVEIIDETCQEGLSHTTDSETIRMTEASWNSKRRDEILVHERVHLDQKRYPAAWKDFYHRVWNYEISNNPPPELSDELRPNPDTAKEPWAIWRQRFVFFPVFEEQRSLRNAPVRIWDMFTKSYVDIPVEWKTEFCDKDGCPHQYEHPHELAAELLTNSSQSKAASALRANLAKGLTKIV
jgi:hypothetical protein